MVLDVDSRYQVGHGRQISLWAHAFIVEDVAGIVADPQSEEAAAIDGATPNSVVWRIMLPLAQPGLLTVAIFTFISHWNEFFWSLVLLQAKELFTISRGLFALYLESQYQACWTTLFAGLLIATVPVIIVFAVLQNLVTEGLTVGALKG